MGKANRRRASRAAATEQTQQSQATQGARQTAARPAPLPTDPGKAPEDCTYFGYRRWAERKYGRLGKPAVPGAAPAIAADGPRFGVCDLCGEQRYCSILCQRTDWKTFDHSKKCTGLTR